MVSLLNDFVNLYGGLLGRGAGVVFSPASACFTGTRIENAQQRAENQRMWSQRQRVSVHIPSLDDEDTYFTTTNSQRKSSSATDFNDPPGTRARTRTDGTARTRARSLHARRRAR